MAGKLSLLSILLFLLSIFMWRNIFELLKWNAQFQLDFHKPPRRNNAEIFEVVAIESNCGIQFACSVDTFPVYLSTGAGENQPPKFCISGRHLIGGDMSKFRGLNAAIIDSTHFELVSAKNFDTYRLDMTTAIGDWLETFLDNDILIIFTSDEASLRLTIEVKIMLNELGSGLVQNIQFRSQWYMITQKGTTGYTTYEKLTYAKNKNWGDTIEFRNCVPRKIPKQRTVPDEPLHENKMRERFCKDKRDEKYKGFCRESRFELIIPALLTNRSLIGNPAYSSPIFIYASDDFELLAASLDSLLHQPGVFVPLITIMFEERQKDVPEMAQLYGMNSRKVIFPKSYQKMINQARQVSLKEHPRQPFIIVIDQDVILSPDFLFFMAQTIQVIRSDETVLAISAWSPNCYNHVGNVNLAFRTESEPKFASLIPLKPRGAIGDIIAPDVSRVQGPVICHLPSLQEDNWITRPQDLTKERYFHKLVMLQQLGQTVDPKLILSNCSSFLLQSQINTIYFAYEDDNLLAILKCLGVAKNEFGTYEGIIRITIPGNMVLLISNESSFYKSRPIPSVLLLTKEGLRTSNQISSSHRSPNYFSYEKKETGRIPNVEIQKAFAMSEMYTTTYDKSFVRKSQERDLTSIMKKFQFFFTEFPKMRNLMSAKFPNTEYKDEYLEKQFSKDGCQPSIENQTTCPMVMIGRDEREPVPLTNNIAKYLDIYVSTTRQDYRRYSLEEQNTIASKEVVTTHETMEIPKGKGYGMKTSALAGQDLDKRDRNMLDEAFARKKFKLRSTHKPLPMVPNFGLNSEYASAFRETSGYRRYTNDSGTEYPEREARSTLQALCPPGMFSTDYEAINMHKSPQAVV